MSNVKPIWIEYINIGTVLLELVFKFSRVSFLIFLGYLHVLIFCATATVQCDLIISTDHVTMYTIFYSYGREFTPRVSEVCMT
jgi:hypothetical protein